VLLTREENELLIRTGPGTPMGEVMRRYWLPALLADELPAPDCPPVRVRLLGEDLVAFRDSNGRVGLLDEYCAHRRASLFFGRNEEGGLRCIYHGWKYDVEGCILDTPVEPDNSMIRHHVRQTAYPCHEVNGVVYTYMGPAAKMPPLPDLPCVALPAEQVVIGSKFLNECNWLQALEGDCDSTHSAYLHRRDDGQINIVRSRLKRPETDVEVTAWGVRGATIYPYDEATSHIRTNVFVTPCVGNVPVGRTVEGSMDLIHTIWQVPRDDETVWRYDFMLDRSNPLDEKLRHSYRHSREEVGQDFRKFLNRGNDYLVDREKQRTGLVYSGVDGGFHVQDAAITESMGPITDRSREHLGIGDRQIAAIRQFLLQTIRAAQEGQDPPLTGADATDGALDDFYLLNALLPKGAEWRLAKMAPA
jgi:nitrite reductase/ring-hydroxylating ferredoxin subunit